MQPRPDGLELEYGWIKPGRFLGRTGKAAIHAVETFFEKPDEATAREARATGSLWNTLVLAAKGRELWNLGWKCFPEMMSLFERLKKAIDTAEELGSSTRSMKPCRVGTSPRTYSAAPERLAVMEMTGCPLE